MAKISIDDGRYFAYLALLSKKPIEKALNEFKEKSNISSKDFNLAYEIASGVERRSLTLDYFISQLQEKVKMKKEQKTLLKMALYQYKFMDRIPYFAICNQTMQLAKHQNLRNQPFLNALLRKFENTNFSVPEDKSPLSLSIAHSYPVFFVDNLIKDVGVKKAEELLIRLNKVFPPFARIRPKKDEYISLEAKGSLNKIKDDPHYYIQNPTFSKIMQMLEKETKKPSKILDLCASPGGKLLYAHDLYPDSTLFANDYNAQRIEKLKENIEKYDLDVKVFSEDAKTFSSEHKFDLIILDVPCSNTGVLGKRVEARYRLSKENLKQLQEIQETILNNAKRLLSDEGVIWYITCSILSIENESVIKKALKNGLKIKGKMHTIYPDDTGLDGGFGVCLAKS